MRSETTFLGKRAQTCRLGLGATLLCAQPQRVRQPLALQATCR